MEVSADENSPHRKGGDSVHKYHLADVLTMLEVACAVILLGMSFGKVPADYALWVFVIGEICDAFDGMCARRWHYPDDGKYRWWRAYAPEIDKISDIILIIALALYLMVGLEMIIFLYVGVVIGLFCMVVEVITHGNDTNKCETRLILTRRYIYLACLALGVITLLFKTSWPQTVKIIVLIIGGIIAAALVLMKMNRLTQNKTPL